MYPTKKPHRKPPVWEESVCYNMYNCFSRADTTALMNGKQCLKHYGF